MNRIYQGRVSKVEISTGNKEKPWQPLDNWQSILWQHHQLFQDAVNYYIVALAALGSSPESKLTRLRDLLKPVWEGFDKKGQRRQGMRESLQRAWLLEEPPTLEEAIECFRQPLLKSGVHAEEMELAGESLALDLGGDGSIQQGGIEYWPYFCQSGFKRGVTFPREAAQLAKEKAVKQVARLVWNPKAESHISHIHRSLKQSHFCNVSGSGTMLMENRAKEVFQDALQALESNGHIATKQRESFSVKLESKVPELLEYAGGSINKDALKERFYGFLVFKHLAPNVDGLRVLRSIYDEPAKKQTDKKKSQTEKDKQEARLVSLGDDPIKMVRSRSRIVFRAFTALPLWQSEVVSEQLYERSAFYHELEAGESHQVAWKEFDVAAFKEALKVYNQFQQNVEKREDKLNSFAARLVIMDGERAMESYTSEADKFLRGRLEKVWRETKGKPKAPTNDTGEEISLPHFTGDARINRLRQIINDDLAEEYRLTDGRRTPYGLRRRTMKGWGEVKRKWQSLVKAGEQFSEDKRQKLKDVLDEKRGGEKREQIGSHKLFEALLTDEAAWSIWREPDEKLQEQIIKQGWAADPLEAFREYCEIREAMEEVSAGPLNFTPADARYSRRLFMFTDVCSFGKDSGDYRHDAKELAVTVPVAIRNKASQFAVLRCRLVYSAPRLLRDRIRAEDGSYAQDWTQPMMGALFGAGDEPANPQRLKDAAVQLMPDYDTKGERRILLNFPLSLEPRQSWEKVYEKRQQTSLFAVRYSRKDKKKEKPLNGGIWESNLRTFWEGDTAKKRDFLYWPEDERRKLDWSKGDWWEKLSGFRVLAADLGTRHAASVALVEYGTERKGASRLIGNAGGKDWFAQYRSATILRLPGENAQVLRTESPLDKDGLGKAFREELYGERGRPPDEEECVETFSILAALNQSDLLKDVPDTASLRNQFNLPELNDKLLVAMRRAQGWIAACISWHWKLTQPDSDEQRQNALSQIREQERVPEWQLLVDGSEQNLGKLREALHIHISTQRQRVQEHLLRLTVRILPLRDRTWEWIIHPDKPDCHLLRQTQNGTGPAKAKLRGQRGLSMARIEQVSELRRRWQSLNQSLRRELGQKPLTASEMRNDPIPDPCPDILTKLENIREQRVNQTAHLIVAEALGLKLRQPRMSPKSREVTDTHGEYKVVRPPVDMIVLEDLARYLSDQGRARSENTRLMKWCHRAIMLKVKMLAEPFGIPVLETPAAYSSRFCSLTGMAGFRAAEISWNDRHEFRWRELLKANLSELQAEITKAGNNKASLEALERQYAIAKATQDTFGELEKISRTNHPHRTLLAPQPGGPMFITAKEIPHPAPAANRKQKGNSSVLPMQADLNAAANLALRAVAHPACAHIHHRLRTERKKATKNQPDTFLAREPRRFGKAKVSILLREGDTLPKERNTNLFYDEHGVASFGRARLESENAASFTYASGPGLWYSVNNRVRQWERCSQINAQRLAHWNNDPEDDLQM
jgi:hypothetical protein